MAYHRAAIVAGDGELNLLAQTTNGFGDIWLGWLGGHRAVFILGELNEDEASRGRKSRSDCLISEKSRMTLLILCFLIAF